MAGSAAWDTVKRVAAQLENVSTAETEIVAVLESTAPAGFVTLTQ